MDDNTGKRNIIFRQIGAKIAYYRTLRQLHQSELAELANISVSVLSRIERGKYNEHISVEILLDVADALKINPAVFLTFNDEEKRMWNEGFMPRSIHHYDSEELEF